MNFIKKIANFAKRNFVHFIVFALLFSGGVVFFSSYWVIKIFGDLEFGQILFHLRFPLLDGDTPFVSNFVKSVILPSFVAAFCLTWTREIYAFVRYRFLPKFIEFLPKFIAFSRKIYAFLSQRATISKLAFGIALFALCLNATNNKLKITRYLKSQGDYSTLYEQHYRAFDESALQNFTPKQNLIVILVESLESTFSSQNVPFATQNGGGGGRAAS